MDDNNSATHSATLPDLLIRYKNSAGVETEREIKQVRVPVPEFIYAACQLEQAERAFKFRGLILLRHILFFNISIFAPEALLFDA